MQNNRLMILGTNEYQNPLILRAKELGYETHVFGWGPLGEIGEKTADVYHPINILDYDLLWQECQKLSPCGVVSVCSELAMHPMNYLLRRMGIPCNSIDTERITTDKWLMRKTMKEAGIDSPNFILVEATTTINEVRQTITAFHFPLIVKPVDLSSSRGVMKIDSLAGLDSAIEYAMGWSKVKRCILEEFVEGPEYSGESIAYQGNYRLLAVTEKKTTGAPHFVEIGHRQPAHISSELHHQIEQTLYRAFKALGITYGAIHPEFRVTPDGRILFMEVATRMGGDCIGTDLTPLSSGYDYMGMVINICCGKAPDFTPIHKPVVAENHYIITEEDLREFNSLKIKCPSLIWRHSQIKPISDTPILKSADRAGYYITITND